jgi:hypothetical protein
MLSPVASGILRLGILSHRGRDWRPILLGLEIKSPPLIEEDKGGINFCVDSDPPLLCYMNIATGMVVL